MSEKLTDKQRALLNALLICTDLVAAAKEAGISYQYAKELHTKTYFMEALAEARAGRMERTRIDADWVLLHLQDMLEADIGDVIDDEGGFLPIKQWPTIWRQMLNGIDIKELFEWTGQGEERSREKVGEVVKIKFIDRLKAIGQIGEHIDVQAFNKQMTIKREKALEDMDDDELNTALAAARAENSPDQAGEGEDPETVH